MHQRIQDTVVVSSPPRRIVLNRRLNHSNYGCTIWPSEHLIHIKFMKPTSPDLGPASIRQVPSKINQRVLRMQNAQAWHHVLLNRLYRGRSSGANQLLIDVLNFPAFIAARHKSADFSFPCHNYILTCRLADKMHNAPQNRAPTTGDSQNPSTIPTAWDCTAIHPSELYEASLQVRTPQVDQAWKTCAPIPSSTARSPAPAAPSDIDHSLIPRLNKPLQNGIFYTHLLHRHRWSQIQRHNLRFLIPRSNPLIRWRQVPLFGCHRHRRYFLIIPTGSVQKRVNECRKPSRRLYLSSRMISTHVSYHHPSSWTPRMCHSENLHHPEKNFFQTIPEASMFLVDHFCPPGILKAPHLSMNKAGCAPPEFEAS